MFLVNPKIKLPYCHGPHLKVKSFSLVQITTSGTCVFLLCKVFIYKVSVLCNYPTIPYVSNFKSDFLFICLTAQYYIYKLKKILFVDCVTGKCQGMDKSRGG